MKPDSLDVARLQAYLDGELTDEDRAAVERLLAESPELRRQLERLRATAELVRGSGAPAPPPGHVDRVRQVVARPTAWWRGLLPGFGHRAPVMAWGLASTCALALLLYPLTTPAMDRLMPPAPLDAAMVENLSPLASPAPDTTAPVKPAEPAAKRMATVNGLEPEAGLRAMREMPPAAPAAEELRELAPERVAAAARAGAGPPRGAYERLAPSRAPAEAEFSEALHDEPERSIAREEATVFNLESRVDSGAERRPKDPIDTIDTAPQRAAPESAPLQAGEVDDNEKFAKYLDYLAANPIPQTHNVARVSVRERYIIQVVDRRGIGVPDARVTILGPNEQKPLYRLRTDASGQAVFFAAAADLPPGPVELRVATVDGVPGAAQSAGVPEVRRFDRKAAGGTWRIELPQTWERRGGMPLDIAFVVDTTGSMGEEIDRIRTTIDEVAARISELPAQPELRFGLVVYRDRGDDYVVKSFPFTGDVTAFRAQLEAVSANGGGDEPEDVNAALYETVTALDWRDPVPALRMAFLIGDAPPHLDYDGGVHYFKSVKLAAAKGIKFFTISSTDNNDLGEYVWRQIALFTRGRFIFVTRGGAAGITPHHVERQDYTVQALPDLILDCVARELACLGKPPGEAVVVAPPEPISPPVPQPAPEPVAERRAPLPLWAYLLILVANLAGWTYAWRRSMAPLRVPPPRPDVPRWRPPSEPETTDDDEA